MNHTSARQKLDEKILSESLIHKVLSSIFPKVNDYLNSPSEYTELLNELNHFGIKTNKQLRLLLKKHRKQILVIDRSPIDAYHQKMYREEMGTKFIEHMRENYWFAYPALLRLALELEFGQQYEQFASIRDGI